MALNFPSSFETLFVIGSKENNKKFIDYAIAEHYLSCDHRFLITYDDGEVINVSAYSEEDFENFNFFSEYFRWYKNSKNYEWKNFIEYLKKLDILKYFSNKIDYLSSGSIRTLHEALKTDEVLEHNIFSYDWELIVDEYRKKSFKNHFLGFYYDFFEDCGRIYFGNKLYIHPDSRKHFIEALIDLRKDKI